MLRIQHLTKSFGDQVIFEDVDLRLEAGERLALVGRNGSGKSTLFRMILGEEEPESGTITTPRGYRVGHLSQHLDLRAATVIDEARRALPSNAPGGRRG